MPTATGTEKERFALSLDRLRSSGWEVEEGNPHPARPTIIFTDQVNDFFDSAGSLQADIPFHWIRGSGSKIQAAFAREGLIARVHLTGEDGPGAVLAGRNGDSDLCRIVQAFRHLEAQGYIAEPNFSFTNSSGWGDIHERNQGSEVKAIFWNSQSHMDCFDDDGNLIDDIPLQWAGDADTIKDALSATGLAVDAPQNPKVTFFLGPEGEEEF
ncbi:hypothetical protein ACR820_31510 [Streptomyces netropsis]